jgi:DNA-binding IclR family transcriptional regulator
MDEPNTSRTLKTAERTIEVLKALKELDGAGVTELADHLDMSKGGMFNHLATLHKRELVGKTDNTYHLSSHFFNFGEYVKHQNPLYTVGRAQVDELAERTGESTHLMVEQFGKGFYYHKAQGQKGISQDYHQDLLEEPDYLHWSSTGKAVLAEMSEEHVRAILDREGMPELTGQTVTDPSELLAELETIRERGYAQNDEEQIPGVRAVGAAVTTENTVLGAISVSGPTTRITDEKFTETYPELVLETKNVIEVNIETKGGQETPTL